MGDIEDDARYPPNSNHRPKLPINPQINRDFDDQDDEFDDDQSNSDEINTNVNNSADLGDDDDDDDDDESSLESLGKRRKLDNFEFVPRKPSPPFITNSKALSAKNSPPDWSEDSTFLLLDAWGEIFMKNGRKSLRFDEWSEVAKKINQDSRITRSDSQCRNRLDTLKKKYRKEKARMIEVPNFKSNWAYFEKMDSLMSSAPPVPTKKSSPVRLSCGVDAGEYVFANPSVYMNRANAMDEMRDSPGDTGAEDEDEDESDGLPPSMNEKRNKGRDRPGSFSSSSFRMLADSIKRFGEVYEKIENSKRQQMVELERTRKEFCRDLEAQKRQILERVQADIARIGEEDGEEEDDDEINGSGENLSGGCLLGIRDF